MTQPAPPFTSNDPNRAGDLVRRGRLAWTLLWDPRVPLMVKLIPALAMLYVISPFDFIPDILPALGQLDDVAILLLALKLFVDMASPSAAGESGGAAETDDVITADYRVRDG